jgi:hypothetical protein
MGKKRRVLQDIFSTNALSSLRSPTLRSLLKNAKKLKTDAFYTVPYASVYRAREEQKRAEASYRTRNAEIETAWQAYPTTPRELKRTFKLDDEHWKIVKGSEADDGNEGVQNTNHGYENTKNDVMKHTTASKAKSQWGQHRGEVAVPGGAHNFYRQVHVCGECSRAYMLLDKARDIMYHDKEEDDEEQVRIHDSE